MGKAMGRWTASLLLLLALAGQALAQDSSENGEEAARQALAQQRLLLEQSIEELGPEHPEVASRHFDLASELFRQGQAAKAESQLRRGADVLLAAPPENPKFTAEVLHGLAYVQAAQDKHEPAVGNFRQAIEQYQRYGLEADVQLSASNRFLADSLVVLGRNDEAETHYRAALDIIERIPDFDPNSIDYHRERLIELYWQRQAYAQAETLYREMIAHRKQRYGVAHYEVVVVMTNLAHMLEEQERYDDAEALHLEGMALYGQSLGEDHYTIGWKHLHLGRLYRKQGRHEEAERAFAAAEPYQAADIAAHAEEYGPESPAFAQHLIAKGDIYRYEIQDLGKAQEILARALSIFEGAYGSEDPRLIEPLKKLANALDLADAFSGSVPLHARVVSLTEKQLGAADPGLNESLGNLAYALNEIDRAEEAEEVAMRALRIVESAFGPDSPQAADRHHLLAFMAMRRSEFALAEERLVRSLEIFKAVHPSRVVSVLKSAVKLMQLSGQIDKAISYGLEIMAAAASDPAIDVKSIHSLLADAYLSEPAPAGTQALFDAFAARYEREQGGRGKAIALLLFELGSVAVQRNRSADAETLFQRSLETYRATGGDEPIWMASQLFELATLARQDGRLDQATVQVTEAIDLLAPDESVSRFLLIKSETLLGLIRLDQEDHDSSLENFARALERTARLDPPNPRREALLHYNIASVEARRDGPEKALTTLEKGRIIVEQALGIDDQDYTSFLSYRAQLLSQVGQTDLAEADFRRAIQLQSKNGRTETQSAANLNIDFGSFLAQQTRHEEAVPHFKRALEIQETLLGADHLTVADTQIFLGDAYRATGRYNLALGPYRRAATIRTSVVQSRPELLAWALERLADAEAFLGDLEKGEQLFQQAIAVWETSSRAAENGMGDTLRMYSNYKRFRALFDSSEALSRRALAVEEKAFGAQSPRLIAALNHLVEIYLEMGRSFDAAEQQLRAIGILETQEETDTRALAAGLIKLAIIKAAWRESEEAEALLLRAENVLAAIPDQDVLNVGLAYMSLGDGLRRVEQFEKSESAYQRALAILEKTTNPANMNRSLANLQLASLKIDQREFGLALEMLERTLEDVMEQLGPDNPIKATIVELTPALYLLNGEPEKAVAMFDETLAQGEGEVVLEEHPMRAIINAYRGMVEWERGDLETALESIADASAIEKESIQRAAQDRSESGSARNYNSELALTLHVALLDKLAKEQPDKRDRYLAEAFELAQAQQEGSASGALARMAARFSSGSDDLARVIRERQDRLERWTNVSRELASVASKPMDQRDRAAEAELRDLLGRLDEEMNALDGRIERDFPDYAALVRPGAVPLAEVQALLRPDEAMLFFSVQEEAKSPALEEYLKAFLPGRTTLWVVRHDSLDLVWIDLSEAALKEAVASLRRTLDPTVLFIERLDDIPVFAESEAHDLYRRIFAPAEPLLQEVRNVFVVPTGPLQSLPLGVLITEPLAEPIETLAEHGKLNWLARDYAMTSLPSVSSLRALRHFAQTARASQPFTGFGNPLLKGEPGQVRGVNLAAMFRGALADVTAVRDLPALPDSEQELFDMAAALEAEPNSVYLAERATEAMVKSMDLSDSRVLAFATHGLVAGELEDNVEPALVMTPPETGSELDDGLLTASEIAQLKLNADWVILSACNTASGSRPGAEGLSGLARAFFYAGSRSLLVSHWPVVSDAAVKLTTQMLEGARREDLTRAEALQLSLVSLMQDPEHPYYAHPMFWAPFTVVGEGGRLGG